MGELDGKVALITGAGRGLGRAAAQLFAREGARVVVACLHSETGEETAKLIKDTGGEATFLWRATSHVHPMSRRWCRLRLISTVALIAQ